MHSSCDLVERQKTQTSECQDTGSKHVCHARKSFRKKFQHVLSNSVPRDNLEKCLSISTWPKSAWLLKIEHIQGCARTHTHTASGYLFLFLSALGHIQFVVESLFIHEFCVLSFFSNNAMTNNTDLVSIDDCGQTVSYDDTGAAFPGFIQSLLHHLKNQRHE